MSIYETYEVLVEFEFKGVMQSVDNRLELPEYEAAPLLEQCKIALVPDISEEKEEETKSVDEAAEETKSVDEAAEGTVPVDVPKEE
jgi:hypothetical protein